jgi:hypothetical protein
MDRAKGIIKHIDNRTGKGIRADLARHKGRVALMYVYMLDMATFSLELYQSIPLLGKCLQSRITGLNMPIKTIQNRLKDGVYIIDHRYVIGRIDNAWLFMGKKDVQYVNSLSQLPLNQHQSNNPGIII